MSHDSVIHSFIYFGHTAPETHAVLAFAHTKFLVQVDRFTFDINACLLWQFETPGPFIMRSIFHRVESGVWRRSLDTASSRVCQCRCRVSRAGGRGAGAAGRAGARARRNLRP